MAPSNSYWLHRKLGTLLHLLSIGSFAKWLQAKVQGAP